jgi:hypothetical protein
VFTEPLPSSGYMRHIIIIYCNCVDGTSIISIYPVLVFMDFIQRSVFHSPYMRHDFFRSKILTSTENVMSFITDSKLTGTSLV